MHRLALHGVDVGHRRVRELREPLHDGVKDVVGAEPGRVFEPRLDDQREVPVASLQAVDHVAAAECDGEEVGGDLGDVAGRGQPGRIGGPELQHADQPVPEDHRGHHDAVQATVVQQALRVRRHPVFGGEHGRGSPGHRLGGSGEVVQAPGASVRHGVAAVVAGRIRRRDAVLHAVHGTGVKSGARPQRPQRLQHEGLGIHALRVHSVSCDQVVELRHATGEDVVVLAGEHGGCGRRLGGRPVAGEVEGARRHLLPSFVSGEDASRLARHELREGDVGAAERARRSCLDELERGTVAAGHGHRHGQQSDVTVPAERLHLRPLEQGGRGEVADHQPAPGAQHLPRDRTGRLRTGLLLMPAGAAAAEPREHDDLVLVSDGDPALVYADPFRRHARERQERCTQVVQGEAAGHGGHGGRTPPLGRALGTQERLDVGAPIAPVAAGAAVDGQLAGVAPAAQCVEAHAQLRRRVAEAEPAVAGCSSYTHPSRSRAGVGGRSEVHQTSPESCLRGWSDRIVQDRLSTAGVTACLVSVRQAVVASLRPGPRPGLPRSRRRARTTRPCRGPCAWPGTWPSRPCRRAPPSAWRRPGTPRCRC